MKLSCLLFAITCTGLQLLWAKNGNGQDLSSVKINLELKNESLQRAFKKIEKQTDFRFAYNRSQVESFTDLNLQKAEYSVQRVLELLLAGTQLSFKQINNKIVIVNEPVAATAATEEPPPVVNVRRDGAVRGKIVNEKEEPVPGASILILGTNKGTAADVKGEFIISNVPAGNYKIQVSALGFQQIVQDITVTDNQTLDLVFNVKEAANSMNEVVVTGYTRTSKREVTGAVSTISSDVIAQTPSADIASVLQGRVAGVTVDGQGGPGNEQVVRIRGIGTLGDNNPLYVIDGVQTKGGLNLVNPNDIESVTILKDAASCALYGARGSNGVIVITTKRGKTGAPRLEYNSYVGYEMPRKFPDMVTPQQWANSYWEYLKNSGLPLSSNLYGNGATPELPDYLIGKRTSPTFLGVGEGDPAADESLYSFPSYRIMRANKSGTDWFDEIFDPVLTQSHQLAVSGATDKSNFAVTFNYFDNKGILLNSFFKRYSIRANTEFKITPWLRVGENIQFAYTQGNSVSDHTDQNVIASLFRTSPLLPMYDIGGNLAGANGAPPELGDNPVIGRVYAPANKGYTARMLGSAYLEVEPLKNLVLQTKIAIDYVPFQSRLFQDTLPQVRFPVTTFKFQEFSGHSVEWRTTNKISYTATINDIHKINAFAAYEASQYNYRGVGAMSDSMLYSLPGFQIVSPSTGVRWQVSGSQDKVTYISVMGNLNYSLLDKYLVGFTYRRDGSSKFGPLSRYGNFPSVSAGWRISQEKFMENIQWLNDLKLRAAIGTSGNDNIPSGATINQYYTDPAYTYYDLNGLNNASSLGFALTQLGNPFLQWEVNKTTNLGFDATLFSNRLSISFNWFNRKTDKLLFNPPVTALQGDAGVPFQNVMNFTNKGIELEVGYFGPKGSKLNYDMNFNIGTYRNNVTYIDGRPETVILGGLYARQVNLSRSVAGMPVGSFYGWIYDGMIQEGDSAGHFRFKDISGPDGKPDGIVNDNDRTFIGNPHPKFTFGFAVNLYYKNFDFNLFVQGVSGNKIFNYWRAFTEWPGMYGAGSLDTWSETNRDAKLPIYSNQDFDDDRPSTFFIEDGSYVRLKSLQLGYTFPRIKGINRLRVYAQAYNLLTITSYSGMDPEVNTGAPGSTGIDFGGNFPISGKLLFGVNFSL